VERRATIYKNEENKEEEEEEEEEEEGELYVQYVSSQRIT